MRRFGFIFSALVLTLVVQAARGQTRNQRQYLVSAKAGVVNFVEGDLSYTSGGSQPLISGDELRVGVVATTGSASRAEILLSPGSYLRLNQNTEFALVDASLDHLKVKLLNGSAIVESPQADGWSGTIVTIATPKGEFSVVRGGLYRFNVDAGGRSEALVYKGRLLAGGAEIKEGEKAFVDVAAPAIASFDKKALDDLDLWSKERAKELIAANEKIKTDYINEAYQNSYGPGYSSYWYGPGYGWYSSWFYNPFLGCYTFLPGAYGFYSPYGWRYRVFHPVPFYWVIHRPVPPTPHTVVGSPPRHPGRNVGGTAPPASPPSSRPGRRMGVDSPRSHAVGATSRSQGAAGRHHR